MSMDFSAFARLPSLKRIATVDLGPSSRHTHASVLLLWYAHPKKNDRTFVELGCATGYVSFGMSMLYGLSGVAVDQELQFKVAFDKGVSMNDLHDRLQFVQDDLRKTSTTLEAHVYDMVVFNPPHFEEGRGAVPSDDTRALSRKARREAQYHFARAASELLKPKGTFVCVINPINLPDWILAFDRYQLVPKRMRMVHGKLHGKAKLVLIRGMVGVKKGFLEVEPPLFLKKDDDWLGEEDSNLH